MKATLAIAGITLVEARRNRVFYSIFFFAVLFILGSFIFTELTIATFDRVLRDVGTGIIDLFGALLAIFLGVGLVSREVDKKTVYTVVTKPIRRGEFIVGKFLGLLGVLTVSLGVMFVAFVGVLEMWGYESPRLGPLLWYLVLTLAELGVVVAFAVLMSSFSGTAMAAFTTVAVYVIGHLSGDLYFFGQKAESAAVQWLTRALYYVLPNLSRFSVSAEVAHDRAVDAAAAGLTLLYGALYCGALLLGAIALFSRRDFK